MGVSDSYPNVKEIAIRTLSGNLAAEQVKTSYIPYVKVYLPDYSGGTDLSSYVREVVTTEQIFGGSAYIVLGDLASWYYDGATPLDLKGYKVEIEWGAVISGSPDTTGGEQAPVWIWDTPHTSFEGELAIQFECIDIWQWLQMFKVMADSAEHTATPAPAWPRDTTVFDIISQLFTNIMEVVLDSTDGIVDTYKPYYVTGLGDSKAKIIATVIQYTNCYIRAEGDGKMHIGKVPETSAVKYTFDIDTPTHTWISSIKEGAIVYPNRVIAVDLTPTKYPDDGSAVNEQKVSGSATDEYSKTLVQRAFPGHSGYITKVLEDKNLDSNDNAQRLAEAARGAAQRSVSAGVIRAPNAVHVELFDWTEVKDTGLPA